MTTWQGYLRPRWPQGRAQPRARGLHGRVREPRGPCDRGRRAGYARHRLSRLLRQRLRHAADARAGAASERRRGARGRPGLRIHAARAARRAGPRVGPAGRLVLHPAKRRHGDQHRKRAKQIVARLRDELRSTPRAEMSLARSGRSAANAADRMPRPASPATRPSGGCSIGSSTPAARRSSRRSSR